MNSKSNRTIGIVLGATTLFLLLTLSCKMPLHSSEGNSSPKTGGEALCSFIVKLPEVVADGMETSQADSSRAFSRDIMRLRAHLVTDATAVNDVVLTMNLTKYQPGNVMTLPPGEYLFTAEILDWNQVVGYRGSVVQTVQSGTNTITISVLERSGDLRVQIKTLASDLESVELSVIRGSTISPPGRYIPWKGETTEYLLNLQAGTWTVFALGRSGNGSLFLGSHLVEVKDNGLVDVTVEIGGTAVAPAVVFVPAGSDLRAAVDNAWNSHVGTSLTPVELRLQSGEFPLDGFWFGRSLVTLSGGWQNVSAPGGATTLRQTGTNHFYVGHSVGMGIRDVTIDCGGVFEYVSLYEGSSLRLENVIVINSGYSPSQPHQGLGRRFANVNNSTLVMDNVISDGGLKTGAYLADRWSRLVVSNSTFEGWLELNQMAVELDNVEVTFAPTAEQLPTDLQANWYGIRVLRMYQIESAAIRNSNFSLQALAHGRSQLWVMGVEIDRPRQGANIQISDSTSIVSHTSLLQGNFETNALRTVIQNSPDIEVSLFRNLFSVNGWPFNQNNMQPANSVVSFRMINPPVSGLAIDLEGNTFGDRATRDPGVPEPPKTLLLFFRDWAEGTYQAPVARPRTLIGNTFEGDKSAASAGVGAPMLIADGSFTLRNNLPDELNDPERTTWGPSTSTGGNGLSVIGDALILDFRLDMDLNPGLPATVSASFNPFGDEITIMVPSGFDTSTVIPSFQIAGDTVEVNGQQQISGQSIRDFSTPVHYTVLSSDGIARTYTVSVQSVAVDVDSGTLKIIVYGQNVQNSIDGGQTLEQVVDGMGTPLESLVRIIGLTPEYYMADQYGRITINNVPTGTYTIHPVFMNSSFDRTVTVPKAVTVSETIVLPTIQVETRLLSASWQTADIRKGLAAALLRADLLAVANPEPIKQACYKALPSDFSGDGLTLTALTENGSLANSLLPQSPISFTMKYNTNVYHTAVGNALKTRWETFDGIQTIMLEEHDWTTYLDTILNIGNFDVARFGWGFSSNNPLVYFDRIMVYSGYSSTQSAALYFQLATAKAAGDVGAIMSLISQFHNLIMDEGLVIPLWEIWNLRTAVSGVTLDRTAVTVGIDTSTQLEALVSPADATSKTVIWSSADESIATVDSFGNVSGVSLGETSITVKTRDGNHTAVCTVRVVESGTIIVNVD
jgi:hypothetical protein